MLQEGLFATLPERERELQDLIRQECERLIRSVNRLLDFSMMESGMMPLSLQEAGLMPIVEKNLQRFSPLAQRKGIALQVEIPPELPRLRMDTEKIEMVLENLLSNALKFTPDGGRVTIAARHRADAHCVEVAVSDTGRGYSRIGAAGSLREVPARRRRQGGRSRDGTRARHRQAHHQRTRRSCMGRKRIRQGKHIHLFIACVILAGICGCTGLQGIHGQAGILAGRSLSGRRRLPGRAEAVPGDHRSVPAGGGRGPLRDGLPLCPPPKPAAGLPEIPRCLPAGGHRLSPEQIPGTGRGPALRRRRSGEPEQPGRGPEKAGRDARKAGRDAARNRSRACRSRSNR